MEEFKLKLKERHPDIYNDIIIIGELSKKDMYLVDTKYGLCKIDRKGLLRGRGYSIRSAIDKTDYFKNQLKEKQLDIFNNVEILGEYVSGHNSILVNTIYGECIPEASSLLKGYMPSIETAKDKTLYFYNQLKENNILESIALIGDYKNSKTKIKIKTKFGECEVFPTVVLRGDIPTINSATDKISYFKNQCNSVYQENNFLSFDNTEYKDSKTKVKVWCGQCDDFFEQKPTSVLYGKGCPRCNARNINHPGSFNPTRANRNKEIWKGLKCKLYIIKCTSYNECFYKIGITTKKSVKSRFGGSKAMPYSMDVLNIFDSNLYDCVLLEDKFHSIYSKNKYNPKIHFKGHTECFLNIDLNEIKSHIE